MNQTLRERQRFHRDRVNFQLMPKVPVVIWLDARSFTKISRKCHKPFDANVVRVFTETMLALARELDGVVFGYHNSDEISLILRNDFNHETDPWMGNHQQKIVSVAASLASIHFSELVRTYGVDLESQVAFESKAWTVPNYSEAVNYLISAQNECLQKAITDAAYYEALRRFDRKTARDMLDNKSVQEREEILMKSCGIDFFSYYPSASRLGVAAYKAPKYRDGLKKWIFDAELSRFADRYDFLLDIIATGSDVFRADRDMEA